MKLFDIINIPKQLITFVYNLKNQLLVHNEIKI